MAIVYSSALGEAEGIELNSRNRNNRKNSLAESIEDEHDSDEEDEILGLMGKKESYDRTKEGEEEEEGREGAEPSSPIFRILEVDHDSAAEIVRKIVPEHDDPTIHALTFRVLFLGTLLCILGASVSQLFFFKSNAPSFSSFFIILLSLPLGRMLELLPDRDYTLFGKRFSLNPGPFSKKEHLLVSILAGSGSNAAYAGEIISIQDLYYHTNLGLLGSLLLLLSTQLIGFSFCFLTYRLLVRPSNMIWPTTLVQVTLFETLHGSDKLNLEDTKDRMRFFKYSFTAIFSYQFIPAVIFPTLTSIATLCLINNTNPIMSILGSGYSGFGIGNISLDWSAIGSTGPLYTPFFAAASYYFGFFFNIYGIAPILYFTDFWNAKSFDSPLAAHLYTSNYSRLNVIELLTPALTLNETKYAEVEPILLTPYFALSYGVSFAVLTAAISTVALWHWRDVRSALIDRDAAHDDIHVQMLERSYEPIPVSYYAVIFSTMLFASTCLLTFYPLQLPIMGLFLAIFMSLLFLIYTCWILGLNVVTELVAGFIYPGQPIANIVFKVYGYMTLQQCLDLTADLKLALYMKIPPKALFLCQVYGTALGSFVNFALIRGVIDSKRGYLDGTLEDSTGQWNGRKPEIFMSASVIWGLIAPARFFSGQYNVLYYGFVIGAILPFIPYYLHHKYGGTFWKKVSIPLILHGSIGPPQLPTNVLITGFLASFLSQYYALRYRPKWFTKYCYVLSSALDAGTSINALVIYMFGLGTFMNWWGNSSTDSEHCKIGS